MKVIEINQKHMTSECWMIQFKGLSVCKDCEFKNTRECSGRGVVLSGKNKKGYKVPLKNKLK
jgi:hypothetical protein